MQTEMVSTAAVAVESQHDILLIQPPAVGEYSPPLGLASLSAYLKNQGFKVRCLDYNIQFFNHIKGTYRNAWKFAEAGDFWCDREKYGRTLQPHFQKFAHAVVRDILLYRPRYVGFSVLETSANPTADLIEIVRGFFGDEIKIIVGGPQIDKDQAKRYVIDHGATCAFQGEAEIGLAQLLSHRDGDDTIDYTKINNVFYRQGAEVVGTVAAMIKDLDSLPFPDFSDFPLGDYASEFKLVPISTSRGCIAKCTFCGETNFMDRFRQMSPMRIVGEFMNGVTSYGAEVFRMNDSLINGNLKILEAWLDELLARDVKIVFGAAQARINKRMSDELLSKLARAGCKLMQFGVETGSDKLLKVMKKGITSEEAYETILRVKKAGVGVQVNLIVGHFEETLGDYFQTLKLVFRVRKHADIVNVNCYVFDKYSQDFARVTGIDDKGTERWRGPGLWNKHGIRLAKQKILFGLMKLWGLRTP